MAMTDESKPESENSGNFLIYDSPDGQTRIEVRMLNETVWLSQKAIAELFQSSVPYINQHLSAIFSEGELESEATIKKYLIVRKEGDCERKVLINAHDTLLRQLLTGGLAVHVALAATQEILV